MEERMECCRGKKLLVLGAYGTETEIIRQARAMGIYTVVTDSHGDWDMAPAKKEADEAWDISWSDTDRLERKCRESGIDGCIAGFSEKRTACAQRLSARLGTGFYAEGVELDKIFDKARFKDMCTRNGVRVPGTYGYGVPVEFPVIVKPADNGGSRGITVCHGGRELEEAYRKALGHSDSGRVLVEEYITGDEVMVYYTVRDGRAALSAMCDRYMKRFGRHVTQLPAGYYFPSKYLGDYAGDGDRKMKGLISALGIRNGLIAFQAFLKEGEIIPFDPTYRLDGTMAYHATERMSGTNALRELILCSLTGHMEGPAGGAAGENPFWESPVFELPLLLGKGRITEIRGLDGVRDMPGVYHVFQGHREGDVMESEADFSQMLCRIQIAPGSDRELAGTIDRIFSTVRVLDGEGKDMVIGRYRLEEWRDIR